MDFSSIKWWLIFTYDPVVWLYIAYLVSLFVADIRYGVAVRIMCLFRLHQNSEDSVFIITLISHLLFLIGGLYYGYLDGFWGISNSYDVRYDILRGRINGAFFLFVMGGAPLAALLCGALAHRRGMLVWKWSAFGFFCHILALFRFLTLKPRMDNAPSPSTKNQEC